MAGRGVGGSPSILWRPPPSLLLAPRPSLQVVLMARLFTKGKDYGPHAFVVQVSQGAACSWLGCCAACRLHSARIHDPRFGVAPVLLPVRCIELWSAARHGPWLPPPCHPPPPQIRDLDTHLPLPGIMVGDIGPKMGCGPSTRAVCAWFSELLLLLASNPSTLHTQLAYLKACLPPSTRPRPSRPQLQQRGQRLPQV